MASTGILKLTSAEFTQASFSLYSTPVDATQGLSISFDFYSYGGSGGDGLSFIVLDGATTNVTSAGGFGGSLGYAPISDSVTGQLIQPGIQGGYIGIGFDEFGNYATNNEGRVGGSTLGADAISIRGSQQTGYQFITGVGGFSSLDVPTATNRESAKRRAQVDLSPAGLLSIKVDFNNDGDFNDERETDPALQSVDVKTANGGLLPSSLRFGFAASTGAATNIHEVGNFNVRTFAGVPIAGGFADQLLIGGTGKSQDKLTGGDGTDQLIGGGGSDQLTGGKSGDRFIYSGATRKQALRQSTLNSRDRITDFNFGEGDRILLDFDNQLTSPNLPKGLFNAGKESGSLKAAAKAAYADKDFRKNGNQKLKAGEAVFFTQGSRTYLSVNDNKAAFSTGRDLLVDVTNISLKPGDAGLGTLRVSNYFV
jgi:serralysin